MERVDDAGDGSDEHLHVQPPAESNEYAAKSMVCTAFTTVNHGPAVLYQRTVETLFLQSESASTDTKALSGLAVAVFKYALPSNRHTDSSMLCRCPFCAEIGFFRARNARTSPLVPRRPSALPFNPPAPVLASRPAAYAQARALMVPFLCASVPRLANVPWG